MYINDLIESFKMKIFKYSKTLLKPSTKLHFDVIGKLVDWKLYRSMIGFLLYFIANKLDIMLNVFLCAQF